MSFIFYCPHCNQKLEAKEEWIGQQVDCPSCKASITVLTPVPDEVQKLKEDERYCPFCGEIIKKRAIICRFCREKLDDVSASGDVPLVENGIAVQKTTSSDCVFHSENNGNTPSDNPDKRYNLYLYESKDSIETIKTIRSYLQCGLKEAKDFLEKDSLPSKILTGESIAKCMEFKRLLETSGASVKILEVGSEEDKLCEKEINLPPDKTPVQEDAVKNIRNDSGKPNDNVGWGTGLVFLALAALLLWLGWLFVTGYPRTTFWIFAPIVGCVILCYADKLNKVVIILLCCGIVFWGWWAHTRDSNSTANSSSTSGSNTSQEIAEEAKKQTGTLVFITDLKNGFGRISPQMSILFVDGKENPEMDEIIYKFEGAVREYNRLHHSSGFDPESDAKIVLKEMGKISEINSLQNRFLNKMTRKYGATPIEYYGNEEGISEIEVGTVFYIYALATFGKDRVFWLKKHTIQPGENIIFFRNDDTAYH